MLVQEQHKYETKTAECKEIEERWKKLSEQIQEKKTTTENESCGNNKKQLQPV